MPIPRKEDFPEGTRFYIKEFDVPLALAPDGDSIAWYNWFGGEAQLYDCSHLKQGSHWEAESFSEWQRLIIESTSEKVGYRISEKLIAPSYWALFIILPCLIIGIVIVKYSISKWVLIAAIIILLVVGEHGLRLWINYLKSE